MKDQVLKRLVVAIGALTLFSSALPAEELDASAIVENAMEILPPHPGVYGDSTIEGVDSDADGVRDDVERHIMNKFTELRERKVLYWQAYNMQMMTVDSQEENNWFDSLSGAEDCVYDVFDGDEKIYYEMISIFYNTGPRRQKRNRMISELSGSAFAYVYCNFDLDNISAP